MEKSPLVSIVLGWNKQTFEVNITVDENVCVLKERIFELTGIPPHRQDLLAKEGWPGVLDDDFDLSTIHWSSNVGVMLIESPEKIDDTFELSQSVNDVELHSCDAADADADVDDNAATVAAAADADVAADADADADAAAS